jgi:hypothetical protein
MSEKTRAYIYRVLLAVFVLLVARGVITAQEAPLWLDFIAAGLGVAGAGLATANTSTKP